MSAANVARLKVTLVPLFIISKGTNQDGSKLLIRVLPPKQNNWKFLGERFCRKSSFGHVRDLDKGNNGIDIQNNFPAFKRGRHFRQSPRSQRSLKTP
nr:hypothetical protein [Candidatus Brachybacter algidus]